MLRAKCTNGVKPRIVKHMLKLDMVPKIIDP